MKTIVISTTIAAIAYVGFGFIIGFTTKSILTSLKIERYENKCQEAEMRENHWRNQFAQKSEVVIELLEVKRQQEIEIMKLKQSETPKFPHHCKHGNGWCKRL